MTLVGNIVLTESILFFDESLVRLLYVAYSR